MIACQSSESNRSVALPYVKIMGKTMGTTYHITCQTSNPNQLQSDIKNLLIELNLGVNHYDSTSTISKFNQAISEIQIDTTTADRYFYINLRAANDMYHLTDGALDPTVMPLVNYWGFGYTEKRAITKVDSSKVSDLLRLVDFDNVRLIDQDGQLIVQKKQAGTKLDFSSLAKGYGVDVISRFLEQKGINDYLVDIGGEVRANGKNKRGMLWRLGINTPNDEAALTDYESVISLDNQAMATSGNYRNFYEVDGQKYAHTLNPKTGYPERNTLLSVTVIAKDCMTADGFATAFMTMGLEKAYVLANKIQGVEAYFLYALADGSIGNRYTNGLDGMLQE